MEHQYLKDLAYDRQIIQLRNEGRGRSGGCGQPMMFGYQASDTESASTNDVNSGLGTHPSYCGGSPGQFAGGSWMGNGGFVKTWAR
jgi:hypothetical protein